MKEGVAASEFNDELKRRLAGRGSGGSNATVGASVNGKVSGSESSEVENSETIRELVRIEFAAVKEDVLNQFRQIIRNEIKAIYDTNL